MSLINEALRKARKEAAERDAAERGTTYREPRAHLPNRTSWLPALVGGVALGVLVAVGVFFFLSVSETGSAGRDATPAPSPPSTTVTPGDPTPNPTVTLETDTLETEAKPEAPSKRVPPNLPPNPTVTSEADSPDPQNATVTPEQVIPDQVTPEQVIPEPATGEPSAPNPTVTPEVGIDSEVATPEVRRVQPPEQFGEVGERVYVLEAEVDGVTLRLDFIVWSSSNPFAQINGSQVSVGQTVEGFLVRSIAREEVTLEGDGGAFRLRVR